MSPTSAGIVPVIEFPSKSSLVRSVNNPIDLGIVPFRLCNSILIEVTTLDSHDIPSHDPPHSELGCPLLHIQPLLERPNAADRSHNGFGVVGEVGDVLESTAAEEGDGLGIAVGFFDGPVQDGLYFDVETLVRQLA
eukprot:CAMPEP_0182437204 /NCGR_PEP_ID=MMETSP1167-20130531/84882_1 /TAXON_ID=2988 /ORGANISM="Mallomonas Sp, Strain CCMP3275" /LENGTH=135 /DNA_ID=CAMNT_0024630027 /DNA_START=866 /DNA_END=1273 /DNA_ORIENTATION=+